MIVSGAAGRGFDNHYQNDNPCKSKKAITITMMLTLALVLSGCNWALRESVTVCDSGSASARVSAGAGPVTGAKAVAEKEGSAARVVVRMVAAIVTMPTMKIGRERIGGEGEGRISSRSAILGQ